MESVMELSGRLENNLEYIFAAEIIGNYGYRSTYCEYYDLVRLIVLVRVVMQKCILILNDSCKLRTVS